MNADGVQRTNRARRPRRVRPSIVNDHPEFSTTQVLVNPIVKVEAVVAPACSVSTGHVELDAAKRRVDVVEVHATIGTRIPTCCSDVDTREPASSASCHEGAVIYPSTYHILVEHERRTTTYRRCLKNVVVEAIRTRGAKIGHLSAPYSMPSKSGDCQPANGCGRSWPENECCT